MGALRSRRCGRRSQLESEFYPPSRSLLLLSCVRAELTTPYDSSSILTPREVFAMMRQEGLQVDYERLPVTDEQAPIPGVYTRIEERVSSALRSNLDDTGFVFNCQMVSLSALSLLLLCKLTATCCCRDEVELPPECTVFFLSSPFLRSLTHSPQGCRRFNLKYPFQSSGHLRPFCLVRWRSRGQ